MSSSTLLPPLKILLCDKELRMSLKHQARLDYAGTKENPRMPENRVREGPNTHKSFKTGKLSGFDIITKSTTPAHLVIQTNDLIGARAVYELPKITDMLIDMNKINKFFDGLKDNTEFFDKSVLFESEYTENRKKTSTVHLSQASSSFGIYRFQRQISPIETELVYAIVIQSHFCSDELLRVIREEKKSIRDVRLHHSYEDSMKRGDENRHALARFIAQNCFGDNIVLGGKPTTTNRYNIIDIDDGNNSCIYYDHSFCSSQSQNGFLLGNGMCNGYWWLCSRDKNVPLQLNVSDETRVHFPMGECHALTLLSCTSTARKGSNNKVVWGTIAPNPYSDPLLYEVLDFKSPFYNSLPRLGIVFSTTVVCIMMPLKVYISTPPILSMTQSYAKRNIPLHHWLLYPMDEKNEIVALPRNHSFVVHKFMPLYDEFGERADLVITDLIIGDQRGCQLVMFHKKNLIKLIQTWALANNNGNVHPILEIQ